jgi:hypothetical protein
MLSVLPQGNQKLLTLEPRKLTWIFVGCDIMSMLVVSGGAGLAASQNWGGSTGINMLLAGLAFQLLTNLLFCALIVAFWRRAIVNGIVAMDAPYGWKGVFWTISASMGLIVVSKSGLSRLNSC